MKRYISAILIPCLLLQLCGCYSLKEISLEELYKEEEAIITTKDSMNFHLKKNVTNEEILNNPDVYFSNDWFINSKLENINIIYKRAYNKDNELNKLYIKKDTSKISYTDISSVATNRIDEIKIAIAIVSLVGIIVLAGVAIRESFKGGKIKVF